MTPTPEQMAFAFALLHKQKTRQPDHEVDLPAARSGVAIRLATVAILAACAFLFADSYVQSVRLSGWMLDTDSHVDPNPYAHATRAESTASIHD